MAKKAASKQKRSVERAKKWSSAEIVAGRLTHRQLLSPMSSAVAGHNLPALGHARAVVIVTFCANTSPANLSRTLAELGVDGNSFQACVFEGVKHAGYYIEIEKIPNNPDTKLIKVVSVIQNAPKAKQVSVIQNEPSATQ